MNYHDPTVMILAAGMGTRLSPLTVKTPKALLEFRQKPMIQHVIEKIISFNFNRIVVNVHHHADQVMKYLEQIKTKDIEILVSDERDQLMDTGGGIIKARNYLDGHGPFIIHNADIFSTIDLRALYDFHLREKPLATLAVKERETTRNLLFDAMGNLSGWKNNLTGDFILVKGKDPVRSLAFSGIHVIDPAIFGIIEHRKPFSIVQAYLELAKNERIILFDHSDDEWIDMAERHHFRELR